MGNLADVIGIECDECNGAGFVFYGSSENYDVMKCNCTPEFLMIGETE